MTLETLLEEIVRRVVREELANARRADDVGELSPEQFAKRIGVSTSTVRAMVKDGRLPAKKVGRLVRIAADATIGEPIRPKSPDATTAPTARARAILGIVVGGGGGRS